MVDRTADVDEVEEIFAQLEGIRHTISASERERERLVLKAHAAGLTTRAIGERVGVSSGTISIWIRLARRSGDDSWAAPNGTPPA